MKNNKKLFTLLAAAVMTFSYAAALPQNFATTASAATSTSSKATSTKTSITKTTITLSAASYIYTGSAIKPTVTVKYGSKILKNNTDYTLSYANNTKVGTASVTVTGKGSYTGSKKLTYTIKALAAPTGVKAAAASASEIKVTWNKVANANGYILQRYDTAKKAYVDVKKTTAVSFTNSGLKANTAYKYRVCAYRTISGTTYKTYSSVVSATTKKAATTTTTKPLTTAEQYQDEVLVLVNAERKKEGLSELKCNAVLDSLAMTRAVQIQTDFSHSYNGKNAGAMLDELNYVWYSWGENIAYGQKTPEEVVKAWMNSPGHRANILSPKFHQLGVGFDNNYWVQVFSD